MRGTQHIHMVLWAANAPKPNAPEEEVTSYIDKYVTARMPDQASEPLLYHLVNRHQLHWNHHSKTCRRVVKHQGRAMTICRFEFPRPVMDKTTLNKHSSALLGVPGAKTKFYWLNRHKGQEQMVNDYNPLLLMGWRGNN